MIKHCDIDITRNCNLSCKWCSRGHDLYKQNSYMDISDIEHLINETKKNGIHWESLSLVGGEPTLHPDMITFANMIAPYADRVYIKSNGINKISDATMKQLPDNCKPYISPIAFKSTFIPFRSSIADLADSYDLEKRKDCKVYHATGINYNENGFLACSAGGFIDETFNMGLRTKKLADLTDDEIDRQQKKLCEKCGFFVAQFYNDLRVNKTTRTWQKKIIEGSNK